MRTISEPPGVLNEKLGSGVIVIRLGAANPCVLHQWLSATQVSEGAAGWRIFGGAIGELAGGGSKSGEGGTITRAVATSSASQSFGRESVLCWGVEQPVASRRINPESL